MRDLNKKCKSSKGTWKSKWTSRGRPTRTWSVIGWTTKKIKRKRGNGTGGELSHYSLRDKKARRASWPTSRAVTKLTATAMWRWSRMRCSTQARICSKDHIIFGRWVTHTTRTITTTATTPGTGHPTGSSQHFIIGMQINCKIERLATNKR